MRFLVVVVGIIFIILGVPMKTEDATIFNALDDKQALALAIYGEARGENTEGKIAVAWVIVNRAKHGGWYGDNIKGVAYKKNQFSCFNSNDPNYEKLKKIALNFNKALQDKVLASCYTIAKGVLSGTIESNVKDATHYHTTAIKPSWLKGVEFITKIQNHKFYKEA